MSTTPFRVSIAQETLDDLRERLARTRWPDEVSGAGWDYGTNLAYMKDLMGYWATGTIGSSVRLYYETGQNPLPHAGERMEVPTAMAMFPKDLVPGPREWAEREYNVQRWTEMPRGGHFGEMEEPELLVEDMREFFRPLRKGGA